MLIVLTIWCVLFDFRSLACGVKDRDGYPVIVYEVRNTLVGNIEFFHKGSKGELVMYVGGKKCHSETIFY